MIGESKPGRFHSLRKILALPVLLGVIAILSCCKADPLSDIGFLDKIDVEKITHQKLDQQRKQQLSLKLQKSHKRARLVPTNSSDSSEQLLKQKMELELLRITTPHDKPHQY